MKPKFTLPSLLVWTSGARAGLQHPGLPAPTKGMGVYDASGTSPRPTTAPYLSDLRRRKIIDGDLIEGETRYLAPDNTCAFIDAELRNAYSCAPDFRCVFQTSETGNGRAMCCELDGGSCLLFTTCVGQDEIITTSVYDELVGFCTEFGRPYCQSVSIYPDFMAHVCTAGEPSTDDKAWVTYDGQNESREFIAIYLRNGTTASQTMTNTLGKISETETETTSEEPSSETTSKRESPTVPPRPDDGDDVPIGPIVGGVVGGVAAIVIGGLALFFYMRRRTRRSRDNHQQTIVMQEQQQQQPANLNDYPKSCTHQAQHSISQTGTVSSPTLTDPRVSYMSGQSPPMYMGEMARDAPVYEVSGRPSERRENDVQEMP